MGPRQSKNTNQVENHEAQNSQYYEEVVEYDECCGFVRKRVSKKGLVWQENFFKNCQDLNMYYEWVHDLEDMVKLNARKLPRKKFIDQFNELKRMKNTQLTEHNQILLSPSQIDEFKVNLKNSVLLSYGQALKPPRPKQTTKIQTIIMPSIPKTPQKNLNATPSFNNPPSFTPSRKRTDMHLQQGGRKESKFRERQRTVRQSFSKSGFRQSIMSFVDDTMTTLFRGHEKQISKRSAYALEVFMKFSLILEKHLTSRDNIICQLVQTFSGFIYKKYPIFNSEAGKKQNEHSQMSEKQKQVFQLDEIQQNWKNKAKKQRYKQLQNRKSLTTEQIQELTSDIKIFLVLLREVVQDYYKTAEFTYENDEESGQGFENCNQNTLITNEENILILVTTFLFKNERFYNHIFNIFKKYNEERERNFKNILESLKDRAPEYFEIKKQYCLNSCTLDKYQVEPKESEQQKKQTKNEEDNKQTQMKPSTDVIKTASLESSKLTEKLKKPYRKCAETLQKISKSKTPTSKMKVIMQCSQKITECISEFYNNNKIELKNQVLDADQVLSIFCFVLSTSPLENIHSNLFMIQHFATENQMISVTGYYYSVLTIAVEQLENMYSSTVADMESIGKSESINSKQSVGKNKNKRSKSGGKAVSKNYNDKTKRSFQKAQ